MRKRLYYKNFKKITLKEISVIVISIIVLATLVFGGMYAVPKIVHKYKNYVKHRQEQLLIEQQEAEKQERDRIEKKKQEQKRLEAQRKADINNYKQNFIAKLNEFYNPAKDGDFVLPLIMKTTVSSDGNIAYSDIYSKDGNGSEVFTLAKKALSKINKNPLPKTYNGDSIVMYILFKYDKASLYDSETEPEYAPSYTKEEALNILKDVYTKQMKSEWELNSMPFYGMKKGTAIIDGTITASGRILNRYMIESSSTEYGSNADYVLHSCSIGRDSMPSSIKPDSVNLRFVFKDKTVKITTPEKYVKSAKNKTTAPKETANTKTSNDNSNKNSATKNILTQSSSLYMEEQISDYKMNAFRKIKEYWKPECTDVFPYTFCGNGTGTIVEIHIGKDGYIKNYNWISSGSRGSYSIREAVNKVQNFGKFPEGYNKDVIILKVNSGAERVEFLN